MVEVNSSNRWTLIIKIRVTISPEVVEEEEAAEVAKWEETEVVIWADNNNTSNTTHTQTINNKWCLVSNSNSSWQDPQLLTCNKCHTRTSLNNSNNRCHLKTFTISKSSFPNSIQSSTIRLRIRRLSLAMQSITRLLRS